MYVILDI